jgi:hypothetical protein
MPTPGHSPGNADAWPVGVVVTSGKSGCVLIGVEDLEESNELEDEYDELDTSDGKTDEPIIIKTEKITFLYIFKNPNTFIKFLLENLNY